MNPIHYTSNIVEQLLQVSEGGTKFWKLNLDHEVKVRWELTASHVDLANAYTQ